MTLTLPTTEAETRTEPPKAWKNKWRGIDETSRLCRLCGKLRDIDPGEVYWACCGTFPTKAEAEAEAAEAMLQHVMSGFRSDDYLGAYFIPVSP